MSLVESIFGPSKTKTIKTTSPTTSTKKNYDNNNSNKKEETVLKLQQHDATTLSSSKKIPMNDDEKKQQGKKAAINDTLKINDNNNTTIESTVITESKGTKSNEKINVSDQFDSSSKRKKKRKEKSIDTTTIHEDKSANDNDDINPISTATTDDIEVKDDDDNNNNNTNTIDTTINNIDSRTIFIGNLPINTTRNDLKKLFRTCGLIDTVRIRCVATQLDANIKLPSNYTGQKEHKQQYHKKIAINTTKTTSLLSSLMSKNNNDDEEEEDDEELDEKDGQDVGENDDDDDMEEEDDDDESENKNNNLTKTSKKKKNSTNFIDTTYKSNVVGYVVFTYANSVPIALQYNNMKVPDPIVWKVQNNTNSNPNNNAPNKNDNDNENKQKEISVLDFDTLSTSKIRYIRVDTATPSQYDPSKTIYVGNLPYQTDESTLQSFFETILQSHTTDSNDNNNVQQKDGDTTSNNNMLVQGVRIVRDKVTFQCKGFAYILLRDKALASKAIQIFTISTLPSTQYYNNSKDNTTSYIDRQRIIKEQYYEKQQYQHLFYMNRLIRVQVCGKRTKNQKGTTAPVSKRLITIQQQIQSSIGGNKRLLQKELVSGSYKKKKPRIMRQQDHSDDRNNNPGDRNNSNNYNNNNFRTNTSPHQSKHSNGDRFSNNSSNYNNSDKTRKINSSISSSPNSNRNNNNNNKSTDTKTTKNSGSTTTTKSSSSSSIASLLTKPLGSVSSTTNALSLLRKRGSTPNDTKKKLNRLGVGSSIIKKKSNTNKVAKREKKLEKRITKGMGKQKK